MIAAGYTDANGDGMIGPEDVLFIDSLNANGNNSVGSNGRVTDYGGYGTPNDLDNNGVYDFLEEGASITAIGCPDSLTVNEGDNAVFETFATVSSGTVDFQWEISADSGTTWEDIQDVKLVFAGLGQGRYSSGYGGRPQFIEL